MRSGILGMRSGIFGMRLRIFGMRSGIFETHCAGVRLISGYPVTRQDSQLLH